MGILKTILGFTPFAKAYDNYINKKNEEIKQKEEQILLPGKVDFYKQFLKKGDLVFDVGANVGNRVEAFLICEAKVIAVEPQPSCVRILQKKFGDKIIIENLGLSNEEGELEMQIASDTTISTFNKEFIDKTKERFKYSKWEQVIKVPITTLDKLITKHGVPQFCKIDVEGFELQVLKGLHHNIPFLSFEYCTPEMQDQLLDCLSYLHQLNPNATYNFCVGEKMNLVLDKWMNYADFIPFVNSKEFIDSLYGDVYFRNN